MLKNNLTFAVLVTDGNWKTDLTVRFCEYYSHKFNDENFIRNIIFPTNVDDALDQCETDYLLIQREGNLPISKTFFNVLNDCAEQKSDLFLGHVEMSQDYLIVHDSCLFINMHIWNELGRPSFNSGVLSEGPKFTAANPTLNKYTPGRFIVNELDLENCFVPSICKSQGSDFAIHQLKTFDSITCIPSVLADEDVFYLDNISPYREIRNETIFEKKLLALIRSTVDLSEGDLADLKDLTCDTLVTTAQGLRPINLAEYFKVKELFIYDINPLSLEFQKMIFEVKEATIFGDIVREFFALYPGVKLDGDLSERMNDEYSVITPLKNVKVHYVLLDAFSYQMEDLIESVNPTHSAVFDFSNIYVYPFNYYRRPIYQVQGLFAQLYSAIKSRTSPSHIMGVAPGFLNMDSIEINTSHKQFETAPQELDEVELTQEMLDEADGDTILDEPQVFTLPPITPITPSQPDFSKPADQEDVVAKQPPSIFDDAILSGYTKTTKLEKLSNTYVSRTVYTKKELFDEFEAIFDYVVDLQTNEWVFKVGKTGSDKRIVFIQGSDTQTFLKHLNKQMKINPKTAVKHFTGN